MSLVTITKTMGCGSGAIGHSVAKNDLLLDRKEDPFQLKDISSKDAKAGEL